MFANTTFWIAQRVPSRTHYVSVVKNHSGNVTNLEKNADFLIADHVRPRDAPPDALSYRFIEECEKRGRLLSTPERTAHLCGPKPGSVREVADASRTSKIHRVPFTSEDDDVIREWVKDAVRMGKPHSGNEIWKDLERRNKRHTWQSWRDRWVKKLRERMPPHWETELRGLDDDVNELVEVILGDEAKSEALKQERQESQINERGERQLGLEVETQRKAPELKTREREGEVEAEKMKKRKRGTGKAPQCENESLSLQGSETTKAQIPSTQQRAVTEILGQVTKTSLRRDQESLPSGVAVSNVNSAASPQNRSAPVVQSQVAQAKLKQSRSRQDVQTMPSSPPIPPRVYDGQLEMEYFERTGAKLACEPSAEAPSYRTKRPKHHHFVAVSDKEGEQTQREPQPAKMPTTEPKPKSLPRPFTTEDFFQLYDRIDDIMRTDADGLRLGLEALAPATNYSAQQWHQFLKDDVLPFQRKFYNVTQKHSSIAACLVEYISRNPHQSWTRWRSHYESGACNVLKDRVSRDTPSDRQESQRIEIRSQTPNKKRAREDIEDSRSLKSPRPAETANISRQRVEIISQSTMSGTSQVDSSRAIDEYDDHDGFPKVLQTQMILAADTQSLDLDIPDPDDVLDNSIAESIESDEPDEFDRRCRASLRDQELINQQLLDNPKEDMDLDFELLEPEGGHTPTDDLSEGTEPPDWKDTPSLLDGRKDSLDGEGIDEAASESSLDFDEMATELMEKGHSPENIITAIQVTSANMPLTLVVLEHLKTGRHVPEQMRGIWTEQDDEDILGGDARKLERVEAKHGWNGAGGCKFRQYFLRDSIAAAEQDARQSEGATVHRM